MRTRRNARRIGTTLALVGGLALGVQASAGTAAGWKPEATFELADVALSEFLGDHLPALGPVDDHGIDLGGIGSDIWHGDGDGPGVYWMITDRGPNGEAPR